MANSFDPAPQYDSKITVKEALKRGGKSAIIVGGVTFIATASSEFFGGMLKSFVGSIGSWLKK